MLHPTPLRAGRAQPITGPAAAEMQSCSGFGTRADKGLGLRVQGLGFRA